jgi:hypothetical protein
MARFSVVVILMIGMGYCFAVMIVSGHVDTRSCACIGGYAFSLDYRMRVKIGGQMIDMYR